MATEEQSASEATDLKDLCREMFDKVTQYLNGELTGNACSDKYYGSNKIISLQPLVKSTSCYSNSTRSR